MSVGLYLYKKEIKNQIHTLTIILTVKSDYKSPPPFSKAETVKFIRRGAHKINKNNLKNCF